MYAFAYIYRGLALLVSLGIPSRRKVILERWGRLSRHALIREIGAGIVGIALLACLVACLMISLAKH